MRSPNRDKRRFRKLIPALALTLAAVLAGCDPSGDPLSLSASAVIEGQVELAPSLVPLGGGSDPSGIEVSIEGESESTVTNADGEFRLETDADSDRIRLRFRRGPLDLTLELDGFAAAGVTEIRVRLDLLGAVLVDEDHRGLVEFEGRVEPVAVTGEAPSRVLQVSVERAGGSATVNIFEAETRFEADGDVQSFGSLLGSLEAEANVRVEGDAARNEDGSLDAVSVKVEIDEDDDDDDGHDDDDDNSGPGSGD